MAVETTPLLEPYRFCPRCGSDKFVGNNAQSKRCLSCGLEYYVNPRAAVVALITDEAGNILVCRRAKEPAQGTLDLPGGFTDLNETAEEAVAREVLEETSLVVTRCRYLFSLQNRYLYTGVVIPTMDLFFACEVADLSPLSAHDDVAAVRFLPRAEIKPKLFGLASVRKGIARILEENF